MYTNFTKHIVISIALFILPICSFAQQDDTTDVYYNPNKGLVAKRQEQLARRKTSYSIDMGGYVGGGGGSHVSGFYVNPEATISASKNLDLTVGMSFSQNYYSGTQYIPFPYTRDGNYPNNTSDAILYVAASYYVNNRLTVHASAYGNLSSNPSPFAPVRGFSVGADYKISRRAWISFNYSYQEGGLPYPYNRFGGYPMGVGNDMFGNRFGSFSNNPFMW